MFWRKPMASHEAVFAEPSPGGLIWAKREDPLRRKRMLSFFIRMVGECPKTVT